MNCPACGNLLQGRLPCARPRCPRGTRMQYYRALVLSEVEDDPSLLRCRAVVLQRVEICYPERQGWDPRWADDQLILKHIFLWKTTTFELDVDYARVLRRLLSHPSGRGLRPLRIRPFKG